MGVPGQELVYPRHCPKGYVKAYDCDPCEERHWEREGHQRQLSAVHSEQVEWEQGTLHSTVLTGRWEGGKW